MCEKREYAGLLLPERLPNTPKRTMPGPFLCRVAYHNNEGRLSSEWAILSWIHPADGEGHWDLDAYNADTQVTSWQPMPPVPRN